MHCVEGVRGRGEGRVVGWDRGQALVARRPGSTEAINFWKMGKVPVLMLVDLPGYGFAYQTEEKRVDAKAGRRWKTDGVG